MLVLTFFIGDFRYALPTSLVREVAPPACFKAVPRAPAYVAGLFNYRGEVVPVVDLSMLALDRPSRMLMSTRVILTVCWPRGKDPRTLGLLAEKVTDMVTLGPDDFEDIGVEVPGAPWLGRVARHKLGLIQLVEVERVLPPEAADMLFNSPGSRNGG